MKVISLLEPYASLIASGIKRIETRSWNTKYRGELYIHASKKKITGKEFISNSKVINLLDNKNFSYGFIIAKCNLVDCILMDTKFINSVKKNNNEYICGNYKNGRYAWIIEDIKRLDKPISAKGQLGIWNYDIDGDIERERSINPKRNVVIIIIENTIGEILLVRTKKLSNFWQPIGGGISDNETQDEAIIREVYEEIGLRIKKSSLVKSMEVPYDFGTGTIFCYYYKEKLNTGDIKINTKEILEYNWIDPDLALNMSMFNATRSFILKHINDKKI